MTDKELKKIGNNKSITHCYIYKEGFFYRPNSKGYTEYKTDAGIYTKEDAIIHAEKCREIRLVPIDIKEHNNMITEEVKDLLSRYIN